MSRLRWAVVAALVCCHTVTAVSAGIGKQGKRPSPRRTPAPHWGERESIDPSIEDLEGHARSIRDTVVRARQMLGSWFRAHRPLALLMAGFLGLMHGSAVAFTALFLQSFGASGWPLMRNGLQRGVAAYEEAKSMQAPRETAHYKAEVAPLRRELVNLAAELAEVRRSGGSPERQREVLRRMRSVRQQLEAVPPSRRAAPVLVAACEPAVVRDVILGIWSGVTVSLTAACSGAVRTIGVGVTLGEVVSRAATAVLAYVEPPLRRFLSRLPAEAVMLSYLGPSLVGSATLAVAGRTVGCWVAYRLQHLAAVLSVSLLSARMVLEALEPTMDAIAAPADERPPRSRAKVANATDADVALVVKSHSVPGARDGQSPSRAPWHTAVDARREGAAWLLAILSLQSQRARGFRLPLYLKVVFLPLLGVEAGLKQLASRLTAASFVAFGQPGGTPKTTPPRQ